MEADVPRSLACGARLVYDRGFHGLDLKAAEKKYEPYLRNVASRNDLTYLFQEMLSVVDSCVSLDRFSP
jgi:hypothetical protein